METTIETLASEKQSLKNMYLELQSMKFDLEIERKSSMKYNRELEAKYEEIKKEYDKKEYDYLQNYRVSEL